MIVNGCWPRPIRVWRKNTRPVLSILIAIGGCQEDR